MKSPNQMITLFALGFFLFSSLNVFGTNLKPDLKVSKITTVGGLCIGKTNKVRVTVVNSQMVGVKKKIPVILYVSVSGQSSSSYVGYLNSGIGPNNNSGLPVWFKEVNIPGSGTVTLKAIVNPDQEVVESVYNNNTKIVRARGATRSCSGTATPAAGAKLTVNVIVPGSWQGTSGTGISGAIVLVKKYNNSQTIASATTNAYGRVVFSSIPKGMVKVVITKPGCTTISTGYNMPSYNAIKNLELNCN